MTWQRQWWLLAVALLPMAVGGCQAPALRGLSRADSTAIDALQREYVRAWLADDTAGVLGTLEPDAILLPPGQNPVVGQAAIRAHWWPGDGSRTRITSFTLETTELFGGGNVAMVRGLSTLGWDYTKDTVRSEQTGRNISLTVFRRSAAGEWRIARQMWGPTLR